MPQIKLKINAETAAFLARYSSPYEISTDEVLKRILCAVGSKETLYAARLMMWYIDVTIQNLDDLQKEHAYFNTLTILLRSMVDDNTDYSTIIDVLSMVYNDLKTVGYENEKIVVEYDDIDQEITVDLLPEAMNIQEYSEKNNITIDEAIYKEIQKIIADNLTYATSIILQRFMYAVENQSNIGIISTIFILSAFILDEIVNGKRTVENALEILYRHYEKAKDDNMDKEKLNEFKNIIYKHNN